jgi:hypothetical protein
MNEYQVFVHPNDDIEAVKEGWSWPGFVFVCCWALYKKLWTIGSGALIGSLVLHMMPVRGVGYLFDLVCMAVFGCYGNSWRTPNLADRGFELVDTVEAKTPEGAVAEYYRHGTGRRSPRTDLRVAPGRRVEPT